MCEFEVIDYMLFTTYMYMYTEKLFYVLKTVLIVALKKGTKFNFLWKCYGFTYVHKPDSLSIQLSAIQFPYCIFQVSLCCKL